MKFRQSPISLRAGYTLVELLVVISILTVLLTLVAIFVVPAFQDNKNVVRGADRVTTTLLIAKQRALRDQAPRGVLFVGAGGQVRQLQYIEEPTPFRSGTVTIQPTDLSLADFGGGVDLFGGAGAGNTSEYLVQPGDWLRIEAGTPQNFQIASVGVAPLTQSQVRLATAATAGVVTTNFKVLRQPRPIAGESPVDLPGNVIVDVNLIPSTYRLPTEQYILFSPSGSILNRATTTPIVLMVRDATQESAWEANTTQLLTINPRTGRIAGHPVGPSGDELRYATDGRSSGL